jgi:hypothetical protein
MSVLSLWRTPLRVIMSVIVVTTVMKAHTGARGQSTAVQTQPQVIIAGHVPGPLIAADARR